MEYNNGMFQENGNMNVEIYNSNNFGDTPNGQQNDMYMNNNQQNDMYMNNNSQNVYAQPTTFENMDYNNLNNNVIEEPKKKGNGFKFFLVIMMVFLVSVVIALLGMNLFKSKEQKFMELLFMKQEFSDWNNELINNAENSEQVNTTIEMDIKEMAESFGEELESELTVAIEVQNVDKGENKFGEIIAKVNNEDFWIIEYSKTGDLYGIRIDELAEDFIAFRNEDIQKIFKKFGIDDLEGIPNRILTKEDFEKVMKIDDKAYEKMMEKYSKAFLKAIKNNIVVEKDVEISLGDIELTTNKYTLNITEKTMYYIAFNIMNLLKNDKENIELVLNYFEAILELMEENGYIVSLASDGKAIETIPTAEDICEEIEEMLESLKEVELEDLDDKEVAIEISVYEHKGKTVVNEICVPDESAIRIKCLSKDEFILSMEFEEDDEIAALNLEGKINKNEFKADVIVSLEEDEVKLFNIKQEYINKAQLKDILIDDDNALIINDVSKKKIEKFFEEISENYEDKTNDLVEKIEDEVPAFEEILMSNTSTIKQANFAMFCQQFGEFSDQIALERASLMAEYGKNGKFLNTAQLCYEVATGIPASEYMMTPIGESFDYDFLEKDEICYEIINENILGYEDSKSRNFYGDENDGEKHYVTSKGQVFTLPGFAHKQEDGTIRYYVNTIDFYEEEDYSW